MQLGALGAEALQPCLCSPPLSAGRMEYLWVFYRTSCRYHPFSHIPDISPFFKCSVKEGEVKNPHKEIKACLTKAIKIHLV